MRLSNKRAQAPASLGAEDDGEGLLVGEVARRSGLSAATVRHFEQLRLLKQARRDGQGRRMFAAQAVRQAIVADRLRRVGLGPQETREILQLLDSAAAHGDAIDRSRRAARVAAIRARAQLLMDVACAPQAPNGSDARTDGWRALVARPDGDAV